ncbi:MAG: nucleotidyltransferase family protein, partial [Acidobacteriota bacterium]|nr:nucleotidyltransferase family protein [Acidobacteriota bacterium]
LIASKHVVIVENEQWESGMGSSIAAGVRQLRELGTDSAAVAVLLVDQPLVRASHLHGMRNLLSRPGTRIVAAHYKGVLGVPAIFKRELFPVLADLEPETGARALLRDPNQRITPFDLPEAAVDVDTPEDLAALTAE